VHLAIAWEPLKGSTPKGVLVEDRADDVSRPIARVDGEECERRRSTTDVQLHAFAEVDNGRLCVRLRGCSAGKGSCESRNR
jgi:hypothetical protein